MKKVTLKGITLLLLLTISMQSFAQNIQRVRLDFETPNGFVRHLLLGFTPNNAANDNYNYGYDAMNIDDFPDDLNWIIGDIRCVIQGVGAFDNSKFYPLGLYISNPGNFKIELTSLENFNEDINVYVYDSLYNSYSRINEFYFENYTDTGEFEKRYFITFSDNNFELEYYASQFLTDHEINTNDISIKYLRDSKEVVFNQNIINDVEYLAIYNVFGQLVNKIQNIKTNRIKLNPSTNYKTNIYIINLKTSNGIISKKIII
ncbi:MAG: T9SS type A sorting domain-containing protein [Flavobacteriaceae bacterium]|nr:T9SS type A sorting domain-containing protein [Flavobacteriaceae bacterium]